MNNKKPLFIAFIAMILWGLSFPLNRICLQYYPPIALAFIKYAIAGLFLVIVSFFMKARLPKWKDIPVFILAGFIGITFYNISLNNGLVSVTSATSSMIMASSPIMIVLLSRLFIKEKLHTKLWIPILIQFSGVLVISLFDGVLTFNSGIIWIIMATILSSLYTIIQRVLVKYQAIEIITYSTIFGSIFLFIAAPDSFVILQNAPQNQLILVIAFAIGVVGISTLLWGIAVRTSTSVNSVGNLLFLPPVFATFFGAIITQEIPTIPTIVGGAIILIGSLVFNRVKKNIALASKK